LEGGINLYLTFRTCELAFLVNSMDVCQTDTG